MKEKLQKVKNFVKEHKVEIAYYGGLTVGIFGPYIIGRIMNGKNKYATIVRSDNKEYIDGLTDFFNNNPGKLYTGAAIALNKTAAEIGNITTEFIGKDGTDEYLYDMVLQKINKKNI